MRLARRNIMIGRRPPVFAPTRPAVSALARPATLALALAFAACALLAGCSRARPSVWPERVEEALAKAGENRAEIEKVLDRYKSGDDPLKLRAAEFLVANMPGHCYIKMGMEDKNGNPIEFDSSKFPNYQEAIKAMTALREKHGQFKRKTVRVNDLETVTADYLIENIDLAFRAWRTKPWAKDLSFEAFCEYVLPYRGSNEPVERWRLPLMVRHINLERELESTSDPQAAASRVIKDMWTWMNFNEKYYMHPTDQGFTEMLESRLGRCEDLSNMLMYCMRSQAIACAGDYTPFWAHSDNNHAWEVVIRKDGTASAGLSGRAAKVYRKTFSRQDNTLGAVKREDERVPRALEGRNFLDVTTQYQETTDVAVALEADPPEGARFVYICVFNTGRWCPIHWAWIEGEGAKRRATFTAMGRNIAYLAAYYARGEEGERDEESEARRRPEVIAAAPPFLVTKEGEVVTLRPSETETTEIRIGSVKPDIVFPDTLEVRPGNPVKAGETYDLQVWQDGKWKSLGKRAAGEEPVTYENVPAGGLYWMIAKETTHGRRLERIFTIDGAGKQVWW